MPESVSVRCPVCRRTHQYAAPVHPCSCGAPVAPPLDPHAPATPVTHRSWDDEWVTVRCSACDRPAPWPHPEVGCSCGTMLRVPVAEADGTRDAPPAPARPPVRPAVVRTARDTVLAAARHLRRLGHRDVRRADIRPPSGILLSAPALLAWVEPSARPVDACDVEYLWLTALAQSCACVHFTLAGYTDAARTRAGALGVPLFVLDPAGTPRPVNEHADALGGQGPSFGSDRL
ncbi:hypothetical protein [Streptomyces glaucescens]|uniref:Uncharacterized protein n=1 Tax=Streptomyces glaucescens TaxID=1907 RepID=A0A089XH70_STRGA|nr:hypothetical protein [Streptomyces glaucescens]AIS01272.1 hypothetical protein SGLAU_26670 [Streptomyces glaucescens]